MDNNLNAAGAGEPTDLNNEDPYMAKLKDMADMMNKTVTESLIAGTGSIPPPVYQNIPRTYAMPLTPPGDVIFWNDGQRHQQMSEQSKRRQTKLFCHFAKLFCERFDKWEILPEENDPLHKVKLVRKDIGASIFAMFPDNKVGVFGGPEAWINESHEAFYVSNQRFPVREINMQEWYGWALGMEDAPEWLNK